jgi:hypothetical protein
VTYQRVRALFLNTSAWFPAISISRFGSLRDVSLFSTSVKLPPPMHETGLLLSEGSILQSHALKHVYCDATS